MWPLHIVGARVPALVFAAFCVAGTSLSASAQTNSEVTLDSIIKAWKTRQGRVSSFDFVCSGTWWMKLSRGFGIDIDVDLRRAFPKPPDETTYEANIRLAVDDQGRIREEYDRIRWALPEGAFGIPKPEDHVYVLNRESSKSFYAAGAGKRMPHYFIESRRPESRCRVDNIRHFPIRMVYRPFDPVMGTHDPSKFRIGQHDVRFGGGNIVLEHKNELIWVDPKRDHLPIRYQADKSNPSVRVVELTYKQDAKLGWVLASWKDDYAGGVRYVTTIRVNRHSINEQLPEAAFEISYPDGTWVQDEITGETYIDRGTSKRHIMPGEFTGFNAHELLHDDRAFWWWRRGHTYVLVINLALIGIVGLTWWIKRRWSKSP